MNFLFAWRYFKAKKTTNAINVIAWISIVAILIGTTALILVLSVFNGFEDLVKSLYSSFYPDIKISPASGKQISLNQQQLNKLRSVKGVSTVSLVAEEKALLQNGEYQSIVYLKGVDENYVAVSRVAEHIIKGEFNTGSEDRPLLVLGAGIENAVGVQSDRNLSPLVIYLPKKAGVDLANPLQSISADTINTAGAFLIQQDFDNKYALTNLQFVRNMLGMTDDHFSAAEISLAPESDPDEIKQTLSHYLGASYNVATRYEQNRSLYSIMQLEKWVIYGVLSLILVVAAFNMVGALTMLVLEKKQDISVLHALGGGRKFIQKIFLSEGLLLAFIGGGSGMILALLIAFIQITYHVIPLQGGSFLIDYFPVKLALADFLLVGFTILMIAIIASWIPARKAAGQQFLLRSE
ncbi:MAG TPA: FtsX-like permease family protein [Chitinophagaceae bacterium]|nr:FtsX-like permease family protein [Chitinophagaceae bacterium]